MSRVHPWRRLRHQPHLIVQWDELPTGVHGRTDGRTIWLDRRLLQPERRVAVLHEQMHCERGSVCGVGRREERAVRFLVARLLIPLPDLVDAMVFSSWDEYELADTLWVDPATVRDRLNGLDDYEHEQITKAIAAREGDFWCS